MPKETTFFSYSRTDSDFVLRLAKDLRDAGAELWLDQLDIKAGSHWDASVEAALNSASRLIVVLSTASVGSNNVMDEVSFALESGKSVIPVLISDCKSPFRLRRLQRIDFTKDYQTGLNQLLEILVGDNKKTESPNKEPELPAADIVTENKNEERSQQLTSDLENEKKDIELEKLIWEKAKEKNTSSSFNHYLKEYPRGIYMPDALTAIKKLEQAIPAQQEKPGKNITSKKYWLVGGGVIAAALIIWGITWITKADSGIKELIVKDKQGVADSSVTISKDSVQAPDTTGKLKPVSQKHDSLAALAENNAWLLAQKLNSIESFQAYLTRHPNGKHKSEAIGKKSMLEKEKTERERIKIGKQYEGGIIFYVDASGKHGLLAAPRDLGKVAWGAPYIKADTAIKTTGTVKANMPKPVVGLAVAITAAKLCDNFTLGGNDNWRLPSTKDLLTMYQTIGPGAIAPNKNTGSFARDHYWSSEKYDINQAYTINFLNGFRYNQSKTKSYLVRAIRAF
jgi:hypothetical protein